MTATNKPLPQWTGSRSAPAYTILGLLRFESTFIFFLGTNPLGGRHGTHLGAPGNRQIASGSNGLAAMAAKPAVTNHKKPPWLHGLPRFLSRHRAAETTGGCATNKCYSPATLSSGAAAVAAAALLPASKASLLLATRFALLRPTA